MENKTDNDISQNLKNRSFWKRLLFMVLFAIAYTIAEFAVWAAILFLIFFNLFTGGSNERAVIFGKQLSAYIYHILLYLTYNTEERPFPFTDWPSPEKTPMIQSEKPTAAGASPQSANSPEATKTNPPPEGNESAKTE